MAGRWRAFVSTATEATAHRRPRKSPRAFSKSLASGKSLCKRRDFGTSLLESQSCRRSCAARTTSRRWSRTAQPRSMQSLRHLVRRGNPCINNLSAMTSSDISCITLSWAGRKHSSRYHLCTLTPPETFTTGTKAADEFSGLALLVEIVNKHLPTGTCGTWHHSRHWSSAASWPNKRPMCWTTEVFPVPVSPWV